MNRNSSYNNFLTGFLAGLLLPVIVFAIIYLFSARQLAPLEYVAGIIRKNVLTNLISLSVLSNLIIFLAFNHFDKLRSSRGVLAVTLLWALLVLAVKIF